jgi:hypothetical protein
MKREVQQCESRLYWNRAKKAVIRQLCLLYRVVLARETAKDALKNIREAIELYLEPVEDDQVFPQSSEIVELAV